MRNAKGYVAVALLILSLCALWRLTSLRQPWQKTADAAGGGQIAKVDLGQVAVQSYGKMGFTKGSVNYLPGEQPRWVVGTENGEVLLVDNKGAVLWRRSLGIGKVCKVTVAPGGVIIVGEQSPAGNIYAIDSKDGRVLWSFATAKGVGYTQGSRSAPMVVWLDTDEKGRIYTVSYRFGQEKRGEKSYYSKVYAFTPQGEVIWQFPPDEAMDAWCNHAAISGQDGPLVFSTATYDTTPGMKYPDNLYWLERDTGKVIRSVRLPPLDELAGRAVTRSSPVFSPDGKTLAFITSDGRGYYYDVSGKELWQRTVSSPAQVAGAWVNSIGRGAYVLPQGVFFTTINTFNRDSWQLPTPLEHPSSNSLFAFDFDGALRYKLAVGGNIEDIGFAGGKAVLAVGRNIQSRDYAVHGCKVVDLADGRIVRAFNTAGPCQAAAISEDGRYAAAIEAPAVLEDGRMFGSYSLHIWEI